MKTFYACQDCVFATTNQAEASEHRDDTWHRVTSARLDRYAGERSCPKGQCLSWPCWHALPAPVHAPTEAEGGESLRLGGVTLTSGPRAGFQLCERHVAERAEWTTLDPDSDTAKRLVRPAISLVQIGSPYVQLKYGSSYLDDFRRIVGNQVEVVDAICAQRTACRNLVPPYEGDPRQHCVSQVCPSGWFEHLASRCREIQPGPCPCSNCRELTS